MELESMKTALKAERPVPMALWSKDHWSTFAYLETRAVDHGGGINFSHMRCDIARHPGYAHSGCSREFGGGPYPTRLKNGFEMKDHDDWDCLEDLAAAGLIENKGTGMNPVVKLTEKGREIANKLRVWKEKGGQFSGFTVEI